GLPPTPEEVDQFVKDRSPRAYENLVDRLLAKPAFGEHWARVWLDLARYADSAGYADDPPRTIWAYRDYVIKAFNANKPFDRFTPEQRTQRAKWQASIAAIEQRFKTATPESLTAQAKWEQNFPRERQWVSLEPVSLKANTGGTIVRTADNAVKLAPQLKTET